MVLQFFNIFGVLLTICVCVAQYTVPPVKFEAFRRGFRAYIPDTPGIQLFAFHGKKNGPLQSVEPGEFSKDITKPENNFWVYHNKDIELNVGDVIHYWIFIQNNRLGYRKDGQKWTVEELVDERALSCSNSATRMNNGTEVCVGTLIFEDLFNDLNTNKWLVENYIPNLGPNFEFNSYENNPEVVNINNAKLQIKPIPKTRDSDLRGTLDLKNGCTSQFPEECLHISESAYFLPPVTSGKIKSKFSFKYGKVEVRAKLPSGDWIFPDISLSPVGRNSEIRSKHMIAYARGNKNLQGNDGIDIGGRMLFAGPAVEPGEPGRSKNLRTRTDNVPFSEGMHTYTYIWEPGQITVLVDQTQYGKIFTSSLNNVLQSECNIVLGVGIGGINDFPNSYKSGIHTKPWVNRNRLQVKQFFDARQDWMPTWQGNDTALIVEYVKVYSI